MLRIQEGEVLLLHSATFMIGALTYFLYICYDLDHMNILGSGLARNLLVQENSTDASSGRFGNPQLMVVASL
jgi:hypothetical protein